MSLEHPVHCMAAGKYSSSNHVSFACLQPSTVKQSMQGDPMSPEKNALISNDLVQTVATLFVYGSLQTPEALSGFLQSIAPLATAEDLCSDAPMLGCSPAKEETGGQIKSSTGRPKCFLLFLVWKSKF